MCSSVAWFITTIESGKINNRPIFWHPIDRYCHSNASEMAHFTLSWFKMFIEIPLDRIEIRLMNIFQQSVR